MPVTASEAYLHALAERTFLKLWAIPNPFRAPGKEISDLITVFGDDIVIFSDKACDYKPTPDSWTGWDRWRREAVDGSVTQLGGALRRLNDPGTGIFLDPKAEVRLPVSVPNPAKRRVHLVGIARPNLDPAAHPIGWPGLTSVAGPSAQPFEIEPLSVGDTIVHLFDGATIDLLLGELDTAPDFIAYLAAREKALRSARGYAFGEADLLAQAMLNWRGGPGLAAFIPDLSDVRPGAWQSYANSDRAARTRKLNLPSRTIDNLIEHFHSAYLTGGYLSGPLPEYEQHEQALRLLAAESRFARRIIVTPLDDIRAEDDQSTPWLVTVPSPTRDGLRYVWLTYPGPAAGATSQGFEESVDAYLSRAILTTCEHFPSDIIVGIAVPNPIATENVYAMKVFDGSRWTDADRRMARELQQDDFFGPPVRIDYEHIP